MYAGNNIEVRRKSEYKDKCKVLDRARMKEDKSKQKAR
jgi:hypothetical protein